MKKFAYLSDGIVVETLTVPEGTPLLDKPGLVRVEVQDDPAVGVPLGSPPIVNTIAKEAEYRVQRRSAYPQIGEQLDMLWKAMDENALPRIEPFYSVIKGVKTKYPKTATSSNQDTVIL